jgi:hypothetical protein
MAPIDLSACVLFASIPILMDISKTYSAHKHTFTKVMPTNSLTTDQVIALMQASSGISGLGPYTIAITIVMVLGLARLHPLVMPANYSAGYMQMVTAVPSLLGGTLATIAGFYFDSKAGEAVRRNAQAAAAAAATAAAAGAPTVPQISHVAAAAVPGAPDDVILTRSGIATISHGKAP